MIVFGVVGSLRNSFSVCHSVLFQSGTVRECDQPTLTDSSVALFALILVILLLPDFHQIDLLGISFVKRIRQAEDGLEKASDEISELRNMVLNTRVDAISQAVATASSSTQVVITSEYLQMLRDAEKGSIEPTKVPDIKSAQNVNSPAASKEDSEVPRVTGFDAESIRLIGLWENVQRRMAVIRTSLSPRKSTGDGFDVSAGAGADVLERFEVLFSDELKAVRLSRNAVAHAVPISITDVRNATVIAERLLEVLESMGK